MGDYSRSELLNEVSQLFRAGLDPGREGGTLNTATEYQQLLELVSTTFLFYQDSIFYVARLAANRLASKLRQEVAILEDLLVLLEDLGSIGTPVRDTATLSNARTAALALDAATSVTGRPETARFTRQMDKFSKQLKANVVSQERGNIMVRTREEARNLINSNLTKLTSLHDRLLDEVYALRDVLEEYLELDIPSRVSTNILSSINTRLQESIELIEDSSDVDNLAVNRELFLQSLANKVGVKLLSTFTDPTGLKYRTPTRPIPSTLTHSGSVVGTGTAASATTSQGPWSLPISAPLELKVSGGSTVTIDLDEIQGSVLNGRNSALFVVTTDSQYLHVCVDPNSYAGTVSSATIGDVTLNEFVKLGFKHLGCPVFLPNQSPGTLSDLYPRFIADMRQLQTLEAGWITVTGSTLECNTFTGLDEVATGFAAGHVGAYVADSLGGRYEILQVTAWNTVIVDFRGDTPDFSAGGLLFGQFAAETGTTRFFLAPSLATAPSVGDAVEIGAAVKTASLNTGNRSVAQVLSDIEAELGPFDANQVGAKLNWHVVASAQSNASDQLALRPRSKMSPFIRVDARFLRPRDPTAPVAIEEQSAHRVLGYLEGELDTADILTPSELASQVSEQTGLTAEVVTTEVYAGGATILTLPGTKTVRDNYVDFVAVGVQVGDQILLKGLDESTGIFQIESITGVNNRDLTLEMSQDFEGRSTGSAYSIFREQVEISIETANPGSSLEVVSAPAELGLSVGVTYSTLTDFEAADKKGNKMSFSRAVAGDLLKLVGSPIEYTISEVQDTKLVLEEGLPSSTLRIGFEVRSLSAKLYTDMNERLQTYTTSRNLLRKSKFNEGVEAIDNAVTAATLPGRNFIASRNQARRVVAELLSLLTTSTNRDDEYDIDVPVAADNLEAILEAYSPIGRVDAVDALIDAFLDRKYDRSSDLLQQGRMLELYRTNDETGSYGGAVIASARTVSKDLPRPHRTLDEVYDGSGGVSTNVVETFDADEDFSDIEDQPEEPFI